MDTTATKEQELAAMEALRKAMFEAQDAWTAANYAVPCQEFETYRSACVAFLDAQSTWTNS